MKSMYDFVISRSTEEDSYGVYRFDPGATDLFTKVPLSHGVSFGRGHNLVPVGGYLLDWGPYNKGDDTYPYRLFEFDPGSSDPLAAKPLQAGIWTQKKFWGHRSHYGSDPDEGQNFDLVPLTSFVLCFIPTLGRGSFELWNFDPQPLAPCEADPLPANYSGQGGFLGAFPGIQLGHELISIGNYVLDRLPDGSEFRLYSFDPQADVPLALPAVQEGSWKTIDARNRLVPIGDLILDWVPGQSDYRLWGFDPTSSDPLTGPVRTGKLPDEFGGQTTLLGVQPKIPVQTAQREMPGTIDYMRERIKHVVYYMLESRSFDNVCGWLYETGQQGIHFIGSDKSFDGASTKYFNYSGSREVHVSKFKDGKLSTDWNLSSPDTDPFHGTPDNLQQMFYESPGYPGHATPDMGGFVLNNTDDQVMETFSPEQLPIMNGLAQHFAVSDEWFASIPGGTEVNRGFAVTGSSFNKLSTWEGGNPYEYWPYSPHRQSIWKVLWSNGITDWKIYNAVLWMDRVYTYQLYLQGQIPSVDSDYTNYLASVEQFKKEARAGALPAFSYLEPAWIAPSGTTSYHPGSSLVPGELALNEIYNALREGPAWDQTLLVVTFDKNGGIHDHAPPPYARKPWPHDSNDGFNYDLMGPRVPAIVVSPWIQEQTVFRSGDTVPFDATSFPATLLRWFGVPKARWGLGDRIDTAPTFETVITETSARTDAPILTPPYDKSNPPQGE